MGSLHQEWFDNRCFRYVLFVASLWNPANGDLAAMGGTYEFTKFASANLRKKNDSLNSVFGGLIAGSVLGFKREPPLQSHATALIGSLLTKIQRVRYQLFWAMEPWRRFSWAPSITQEAELTAGTETQSPMSLNGSST